MNLFEKERWIAEQADTYEHRPVEELLALAVDTFPSIALACSFGAEDVVLVHMLQKVRPGQDVFYLDTDFHFKETYDTRDRLAAKYNVEFIQIKPALTPEEQAKQHGPELWKTNPNACCHLRKVEPLIKTLAKYDAWITGIRREQAKTRANAKKVEYDVKFGLVKFNPLVNWTQEQVWSYIREHEIPYNPLHDRNYPSIGCEPCTRPVLPGEDPRAGRWSGTDKTECGLHQ
jgi:phosphoadenosine phosphosulfate reductase